jgi:hypothetical protein
MVAPFDVLTVTDAKPTWLGCADTLSKALELASKNGSGLYLVYSQQNEQKNVYEVTSGGSIVQVVSETSIQL